MNKKNLYLYFTGRAISITGNSIQNIAIMLFILSRGDVAKLLPLLVLTRTIPEIAILPLAGVIGDRFNRKKIMIVSDYLNGLLMVILGLTILSGNFSVLVLLIINTMHTILSIFFRASTRAMLPEIVTSDELVRANGYMRSYDNFAQVVGPVIGSILYWNFGIAIAILINSVSYILSAISEHFIVYECKETLSETLTKEDVINDINDGFKFILKSRSLKQLCLFYMLSSGLLISFITILLPIILKNTIKLSDAHITLTYTIYAVGLIMGGILLATVFSRYESKLVIRGGLVSQAITFLLLAIIIQPMVLKILKPGSMEVFVVVAGLYAAIGAIDIIWDSRIESNMQLIIPTEYRSRVMSTTQLLFGLGIPLAEGVAGLLINYIEMHDILLVWSILYTVVICLFVLSASTDVYEINQEGTLN